MTDWDDPEADERQFMADLGGQMSRSALYTVFALAVSVILLLAYL